MRAGQGAGTQARPPFVTAGRAGAPARARRPSPARLQEGREKSASVAIASSLFLVLIAAALLVGGHAAVDLLRRSAIAVGDAKELGDVVYTMPDGVFCRHLSFDNVTAEVSEGALERCGDDIAGRRPFAAAKFPWGAH